MRLQRLQNMIRCRRIPASIAPLVAHHMLGLLRVRYVRLWPFVRATLACMAEIHGATLWKAFSPLLHAVATERTAAADAVRGESGDADAAAVAAAFLAPYKVDDEADGTAGGVAKAASGSTAPRGVSDGNDVVAKTRRKNGGHAGTRATGVFPSPQQLVAPGLIDLRARVADVVACGTDAAAARAVALTGGNAEVYARMAAAFTDANA